MVEALLKTENLRICYGTLAASTTAVDRVSITLAPGDAIGVVGESGCGKSTLLLAIAGLLPANGWVASGGITFDGRDLTRAGPAEWREIRGRRITMVFQDPESSLNPTFTVRDQLVDVVRRAHPAMTVRQAAAEALRLLRQVKIPAPEATLLRYPFQLSGGMLQRVMIAMAIACNPSLLLADEPTTALDVTVQAQILHILYEMVSSLGAAMILVSHSLGVVAKLCNMVHVMYGGEIVESSPAAEFFRAPLHPYSHGLFEALPRVRVRQALKGIPGSPPALTREMAGCRFQPRCTRADKVCVTERPRLRAVEPGHLVACHAVAGTSGGSNDGR